ncbi:MAG: hypothetical protein AAB368_01770, partial [bacterium]
MSRAGRMAFAAWLLPVCAARAGCGPGATGTAWRDGFPDLGCLAEARQAVAGPGGRGVTVSPAKQVWRLPGGRRFHDGEAGPGTAVTAPGTERETVVLAAGARSGAWRSPSLDTFSSETVWVALEWRVEQNERIADPSCACPTPGSPLTPVTLAFGVGNAATPACAERLPAPLAQAGRMPFPAGARGRYFRVEAVLRGRTAAGEVDSALAPRGSVTAFAGAASGWVFNDGPLYL